MVKFVLLFLFYFYLVADIVGAVRVLSAAASPPQLRHVELDPPPGREGVT